MNFQPPTIPTSNRLLAHAAVLCTNLFFALNFSLVKLVSPEPVPPFALNLLRASGSVGLFWVLWVFGTQRTAIRRADWPRFALCALTGVAINQLLFIKGLTLTTTTHASLLMLCTPLLITLFAVWVLREGWHRYKAIGLLMGLGGAALLIAGRVASGTAQPSLLGDALIVINALSYAVYFILVKPLMQRYTALQVIRTVFTLGALMMVPFCWGEVAATPWASLSMHHWSLLGVIVVAGTFLAYLFNAYGIQRLGAATTGSYIYTQAVFALGFASILLGEQPGWRAAVAAALIFGGVYLAGRSPRAEG